MDDIDGAVRRWFDCGDRSPPHTRRELAPRARSRVRLRKVVARLSPLLSDGRYSRKNRNGQRNQSALHHRRYYSESTNDSMPRLTDKDAIRMILRRDPAWCVYALGDLSTEMFPKTEWFTPNLSMVLKDYGTCILFAMGAASVREALDAVTWPVHLQVQGDALDVIAQHAQVEGTREMWRMIW